MDNFKENNEEIEMTTQQYENLYNFITMDIDEKSIDTDLEDDENITTSQLLKSNFSNPQLITETFYLDDENNNEENIKLISIDNDDFDIKHFCNFNNEQNKYINSLYFEDITDNFNNNYIFNSQASQTENKNDEIKIIEFDGDNELSDDECDITKLNNMIKSMENKIKEIKKVKKIIKEDETIKNIVFQNEKKFKLLNQQITTINSKFSLIDCKMSNLIDTKFKELDEHISAIDNKITLLINEKTNSIETNSNV